MKRSLRAAAATAAVLALSGLAFAQPVTTAFTYQARVRDAGLPANGPYDFEFRLFDAAAGGTQQGPTILVNDLNIVGGIAKVDLNFGPVFDGNRRWLRIGVRPGASVAAYTLVTPRQELTMTPHAAVGTEAVDIEGPTAGERNVRIINDPDRDGGAMYFNDDDGSNFFRLEEDVSDVGSAFMALGLDGDARIILDTDDGSGNAFIQGTNNNGSTTWQILGGANPVLSARGVGSAPPLAAKYRVFWPGSGNLVGEFTAQSGGDTDDIGGALYLYDDLTGVRTFTLEPDISTGGGAFMAATAADFSGGWSLQTTTGGTGGAAFSMSGGSSFFNVDTNATGDSAVDIANGAVSAIEMFNEPGVANAFSEFGATVPTAPGTMLSRSITVPAAGYVFVIASADAIVNHVTGTDTDLIFAVDDAPAVAGFVGPLDIQTRVPAAAPSGTYDFPVTCHALFAVAGAGAVTYYFNADEVAGASSSNLVDIQLTLIYFPTAYGTVQPNMPVVGGPLTYANDASHARGPLTIGEINAERAQAEDFNLWRIQSEMDQMQAQMDALRAQLEQTRREQGGDRRAPEQVPNPANDNNEPAAIAPIAVEPIAVDGR